MQLDATDARVRGALVPILEDVRTRRPLAHIDGNKGAAASAAATASAVDIAAAAACQRFRLSAAAGISPVADGAGSTGCRCPRSGDVGGGGFVGGCGRLLGVRPGAAGAAALLQR